MDNNSNYGGATKKYCKRVHQCHVRNHCRKPPGVIGFVAYRRLGKVIYWDTDECIEYKEMK